MTINDLNALASGYLNIVVSVTSGLETVEQLTEHLVKQGQENIVEIDASKVKGEFDLFPFDNRHPSLTVDAEVLIVTGLESASEDTLNMFVGLMNTRLAMRVSWFNLKKIIVVTRGEDPLVWDRLIHTNNTVIATANV